jgi:dihydroorotate dehydrogenase
MSFLFISPPFGNYFPEFLFNNTILTNNNYKLKSIVGSFTIEKRDGLIMQLVKTLRYSNKYGGWTNKIGLRNPGLSWAIDNYYKKNNNIVSIVIIEKNDIEQVRKMIPDDMDIEVNISCPNVDKDNNIYQGIDKLINPEREWCIIKLPPTISVYEIDNLYSNGWRQFHCSNTIPVKEGGLSGSSIKPYTNKHTKYISEKYPDTIVISGGGIREYSDIISYKKMGATHYSISTLLFNPIKFLNLIINL